MTLKFFRKQPNLHYLLSLCTKFQQERDEARSIAERQQKTISQLRLELSLKPDPSIRVRRLAQFNPERRQRYLRNIQALGLADVPTLIKETAYVS